MLRKVGGSYLFALARAKRRRQNPRGIALRLRLSSRAPMTGFQASSAFLLVTLGSLGSMCHGQSSSPGADTTKDPAAAVDVTLPGVDASMLTPREKREWSQEVSDLLAPCSDTPVSIAQCVTEK